MDPPTIETVLVGVDGSEESMAAAELAVAIADRYGARVVALFVLDRDQAAELTVGTTTPDDLSRASKAFLEEVERLADGEAVSLQTATAYGFAPGRKLVHPGSVMLDAADEFGADFVVLPREPLGGGTAQAGTLAKAAEYALQYASQPILAV